MNIHYFQRYHQHENVVTANLMLLFSRLYHYSSNIFYNVIGDLIGSEVREVEFQLQPKGASSVPDAIISQKSFKIIVETKLYNQFAKEQLINHIKNFNNEDYKILLTVDPKHMNKELSDLLSTQILEINKTTTKPINHVNKTFEEIIEIIGSHLEDRDHEMLDILNDFRDYCLEEKLIDDSGNWMRAIVAKTTLENNIKNGLYFDGYEKGFSKHGYIGLYKDKSIRAIGKIEKIAYGYMENGEYKIELEQGKMLTDSDKNRIEQAIKDSEAYYGNGVRMNKHRFFLVDKFYETNFYKDSPYPIQRSKYFNLYKIAGNQGLLDNKKLPNTKTIAECLKNKSWEETNV